MLEELFIPILNDHLPVNFIFKRDNAPIHTANAIKTIQGTPKCYPLEWPAQFLVLKPIENMWHFSKHQLRHDKPKNSDVLWSKIQKIWHAVTPDFCRKLIGGI